MSHLPDLELRADLCHELLGGERLDDVVVGARRVAVDARFLAGARREQHHRQLRGLQPGAQLLEQAEAVQLRHHHIGEHQVERLAGDQLEGLGAVGRGRHPPARAQQPRHVVAQVGVVFDHQDVRIAVARRRGIVPLLAATAEPADRLLCELRRGDRHRGRGFGGHPLLRQVRATERHPHGKGAAASGLARHLDAAAVHARELLHEGKADAGAFVSARARALHTIETLEEPRQLAGGDADAGVVDAQFRVIGIGTQRDFDPAVEGELECVRDEIEDDLLPHRRVDVDRLRERRAVDDQPQPGPFAGRAEIARKLGGELREIGGRIARLHAAGLDAGEVEERIDEPLQAEAVTLHELRALALACGERALAVGERVLERSEEQRERRAELVADVREEGGLRTVEAAFSLLHRVSPDREVCSGRDTDVVLRGVGAARHGNSYCVTSGRLASIEGRSTTVAPACVPQ